MAVLSRISETPCSFYQVFLTLITACRAHLNYGRSFHEQESKRVMFNHFVSKVSIDVIGGGSLVTKAYPTVSRERAANTHLLKDFGLLTMIFYKKPIPVDFFLLSLLRQGS